MDEIGRRKAIETVIQRAFPSSTLRDLAIKAGSNSGDNFVGVLYALDAQLENNDGVVERKHLLLKTTSENQEKKEFTDNLRLFKKEAAFYRDFLPELLKFQDERAKVNCVTTPFIRCYDMWTASESEDKGLDKDFPWDYILMPDLREKGGFVMGNRFTGLDFAHCTLVIDELAKFHALTYAYLKTLKSQTEIFAKFPLLRETIFTKPNEATMKDYFAGDGEVALEILSQTFPIDSDEYQHLKGLMEGTFQINAHFLAGSTDVSLTEMLSTPVDLTDVNLTDRERKERNQWLVIGHGDPYVSNFLFQYTDKKPTAIKLIDFQLVGEYCVSMDLAYFFYLSTTVEFRSEYLDQLLGIYCDTFRDACENLSVEPWADFTLENLKTKYRKASIFGASIGMGIMPDMLKENNSDLQSELSETQENIDNSSISPKTSNIKHRLVSTANECFAEQLFNW